MSRERDRFEEIGGFFANCKKKVCSMLAIIIIYLFKKKRIQCQKYIIFIIKENKYIKNSLSKFKLSI